MNTTTSEGKAVVHVSGTMLRRVWYGRELRNVIVVRPGGDDRDKVAYLVNQVRLDGPSRLVFDAKPREPSKGVTVEGEPGAFIGALPGFDGAVMVYLEVDEHAIHVQPNHGDEFIPFARMREMVGSHKIQIPVIDPRLADGC